MATLAPACLVLLLLQLLATGTVSGQALLPSIASGYKHTCAITPNASSSVTCWGDDEYAQLKTMPKDLGSVTHLSAGGYFTCAHTPAKSPPVTCWGNNAYFQTDVPKNLTGPVTQVAVGPTHACALVPSEKPPVRCWGGYFAGAIRVPADLPPTTQVSAGYRHTCALTPSTEPPVTCWGSNAYNELEVPTTLMNVTQIQASENYTCVLMPGASPPVECWGGENEYGELDVPVSLSGVRAISTKLHTCALKTGPAPNVECWGWNEDNQAEVPSNLPLATQVSVGSWFSCAVTPSVTPPVRCWGWGPNQTQAPATLRSIAEPLTSLDPMSSPAPKESPAPAPPTSTSPAAAPQEVSSVLELRGTNIMAIDAFTVLRTVAQQVNASGVSVSPVSKTKPGRRRLLAGEATRSLLQSSETGYVTVRLATNNPEAVAAKLKASNLDLAKPLQAAGLTGVQSVSVLSAAAQGSSTPPPTTPGASPPSSPPPPESKSSIGPIVGGAAGGAIAAIVIILAAVFVIRRRGKRQAQQMAPAVPPPYGQPAAYTGYSTQSGYTNSGSTGYASTAFNNTGPTNFAMNTGSTYQDEQGLHYSIRPEDAQAFGLKKAGSQAPTGHGQLAPVLKDSARSSEPRNSGPPNSGPPASGGSGNSWMQRGSSGAVSGTTSTIESSVWIPPGKLQIERKPDGSEWVLGEGSYGKVYKATLNEVEEVAAKVIKVSSDMQRSIFAAEREVALLKECLSHYVVRFLGASVEDQQIAVVTEFCHGGDLWHALKRDRTGEYRWYNRGRQIALDVTRGLHYLHEMKHVIHFDLKSPNVLLDKHGNAKIADVGLSKILRDTTNNTISTGIGTMMWASPEQIMGKQCDYKADIWSLGIILWEICTGGETPPQARFLRELRVPEECPPEIAQLCYACRDADPRNRPTALEVYNAIKASPGPQ